MKYLFTLFLITSFALLANNEKQNSTMTLDNDGEETLSVLTLNTWGLPVWFGKSTNKSRYKKLIENVTLTNADIVCLQETFHPKIRERIQTLIRQGYNTNTYFECNRYANGLVKMDCFGGLITMTKYPIVKENFYKYEITDEYCIIEVAGRKGFLFTTINVNGEYIGSRESVNYLSSTQKTKTGNYTIWNAVVDYDISKNFSTYLKLDNVFNKDYQIVDGYATSQRAAYVGLKASF